VLELQVYKTPLQHVVFFKSCNKKVNWKLYVTYSFRASAKIIWNKDEFLVYEAYKRTGGL